MRTSDCETSSSENDILPKYQTDSPIKIVRKSRLKNRASGEKRPLLRLACDSKSKSYPFAEESPTTSNDAISSKMNSSLCVNSPDSDKCATNRTSSRTSWRSCSPENLT